VRAQSYSGSAQPSAGNYLDVEPTKDRHQHQLLYSGSDISAIKCCSRTA
jgi:hypothetical protein